MTDSLIFLMLQGRNIWQRKCSNSNEVTQSLQSLGSPNTHSIELGTWESIEVWRCSRKFSFVCRCPFASYDLHCGSFLMSCPYRLRTYVSVHRLIPTEDHPVVFRKGFVRIWLQLIGNRGGLIQNRQSRASRRQCLQRYIISGVDPAPTRIGDLLLVFFSWRFSNFRCRNTGAFLLQHSRKKNSTRCDRLSFSKLYR